MGKIVKYCAVCEEGFAEKFSFCPNCAASLSAFEMKPVEPVTEQFTELPKGEEPVSNPVLNFEAPPTVTENITDSGVEEVEPTRPAFLMDDEAELLDLDSDIDEVDEPEKVSFTPPVPVVSAPPVVPAKTVGSFDQAYNVEATKNVYEPFSNSVSSAGDFQPDYSKPVIPSTYKDDGVYHVALVEDKGSKMRQLLLLGAFVSVMCITFAGVVISLFTNNLNIGAINDDSVIAYLPGDAAEIEEEKPEVKKEDKGGGGGGGKNHPTPTSQGEIAPQMKSPTIPPSADMDRVTTPAIPIKVATEGKPTNETAKDRYGNPNSTYTVASDGMGSGGGQGEGNGRGQGNGNGTGRGNGNGSGSGNGVGNGNGDGSGDGSGSGDPPPLKPKAPPVTVPIKILANPKATYSDEGRQNSIQGVVRLRVTLMANGSIGSISVVSGLPNGLTERAIAAARQIRFEPPMVNGVAQTLQNNLNTDLLSTKNNL